MKEKLRILAFIPMLFMMLLIWGFSANTGDTSSEQSISVVSRVISVVEKTTGIELTEEERICWEERIHTPVRKLAHMTEYMVFSCTVAFPFLLYKKRKDWITKITFSICVCYASIDEIHQLFVPDRSGQIKDVLIDTVGILIGIFVFRKIYGVIHSSEI